MSKGDQLIERGAARLEELSRNAAAKGGLSAKLADELAEDAAFLRKLKPSLIAARARGQYVPAENVAEITEGQVRLDLTKEAAEHLAEYTEPPPSEQILPE